MGDARRIQAQTAAERETEIRSHNESMLLQRVSQGIGRSAGHDKASIRGKAWSVRGILDCRLRVIFVHDLRKYTTR